MFVLSGSPQPWPIFPRPRTQLLRHGRRRDQVHPAAEARQGRSDRPLDVRYGLLTTYASDTPYTFSRMHMKTNTTRQLY